MSAVKTALRPLPHSSTTSSSRRPARSNTCAAGRTLLIRLTPGSGGSSRHAAALDSKLSPTSGSACVDLFDHRRN